MEPHDKELVTTIMSTFQGLLMKKTDLTTDNK